jgi:2-succinyl-6-hydroxy-2,4-cyclohexadiene-1-carboxylate synthase
VTSAWPVGERWIEVGGVRLHARIEGEGPPVLVLHGFTGSTESMSGVAGGLRDRHRVIRLDLVGHGRSDAPHDTAAYRMEAVAAHVVRVAEALAPDPPHLIGYSMGGRTALAAAVMAPERFASLVLVGATAGIADPEERAARIAADRALADRIERDGIASFVDAWMALPLFASQARLGARALEAARAQRLRNRPRGLANSLRGMGAGAQPPLHDALARLHRPVLLVVGAEDAKFRAIADRLAARLPDVRIAVLDDAGHAAHLEAPAAFDDAVRGFLADVDAKAGRPAAVDGPVGDPPASSAARHDIGNPPVSSAARHDIGDPPASSAARHDIGNPPASSASRRDVVAPVASGGGARR